VESKWVPIVSLKTLGACTNNVWKADQTFIDDLERDYLGFLESKVTHFGKASDALLLIYHYERCL